MKPGEDKAPATQTAHWAAINEVSFLAGIRLMFWICKVFGRWPFRLILYPVLLWYVLVSSSARRASREYLKRVNQIAPIGTSIFKVIQHFAAFAEMMLDKMLLWSGLFDTSSVQYFGVEQMEQLIAEKRGAILICSHLGNLDLCRVLSSKRNNLKLTVLVHTKHAQVFNNMLGSINPNSQLNLMQVSEMTPATAMLLAEKVAQGEFIVIAGDRVPVAENPRVAVTTFLGQPAAFPIGPYVLASILQCPIYMLFSMRRESGTETHSEIHFELLRDAVRLPRKGREQALTELVAAYVARLEAHCLSAPLQWFNFYDYWHLPQLDISDATR
ncbi:acyltransferase [Solimicrobium silvestre]|uniref:Putative acyltransferase n=1 Tax=Solimicrobium silvestre TaxID=2099400 RepID=A0A2S9H5E1_9BURK|nr:acyltransferase [Solimicrobium silvestre]PRC95153.1 putative acyltransferase [Solimicrobium silvestre]